MTYVTHIGGWTVGLFAFIFAQAIVGLPGYSIGPLWVWIAYWITPKDSKPKWRLHMWGYTGAWFILYFFNAWLEHSVQ